MTRLDAGEGDAVIVIGDDEERGHADVVRDRGEFGHGRRLQVAGHRSGECGQADVEFARAVGAAPEQAVVLEGFSL